MVLVLLLLMVRVLVLVGSPYRGDSLLGHCTTQPENIRSWRRDAVVEVVDLVVTKNGILRWGVVLR